MSMNEELQSANEELETSKEELQSFNEELTTVNGQLEEKILQFEAATNDMTNLLASSDIAVVFLDAELHIKLFTPPTAKLLNLLKSDIGRPFRDISPRFTDPQLVEDCHRVLEHHNPDEKEVWTEEKPRPSKRDEQRQGRRGGATCAAFCRTAAAMDASKGSSSRWWTSPIGWSAKPRPAAC